MVKRCSVIPTPARVFAVMSLCQLPRRRGGIILAVSSLALAGTDLLKEGQATAPAGRDSGVEWGVLAHDETNGVRREQILNFMR